MRRRPVPSPLPAFATAVCLSFAGFAAPLVGGSHDASAQAIDENTRVMWQLHYAGSLPKKYQDEVQNTLLSTLSRVRERHFATSGIIAQKVRNEGFRIPSCFEEGGPCPVGPAFLIDVHNVDVYIDATFDRTGDEWIVNLNVNRRLSSSTSVIHQTGRNLSSLMNSIVGSLFVLESSISITSTVPDVEVYLNQKLIGTTPLSMKIAEGSQKLIFKKKGYFQDSWSFVAKKGTIHSHEVELQPETTPFTVLSSDDEAEILVDGQVWEKNGVSREILPGEHHVEITSLRYRPYEQDITVYSGVPQTMQVSLLPNPRDPLEIRAEGIKKYRFSATAGYHFGIQKFNMGSTEVDIRRISEDAGTQNHISSDHYGNTGKQWAETSFHGMSFAFNYEDEFWGVTVARLDLLGSPIESPFKLITEDTSSAREKALDVSADGATLIAFYPAQIKAHYNFWIMQAEVQAGIGLSWTKLNGTFAGDSEFKKQDFSLSRTQFSANFDFGLKFFLSEESFAMVNFGFQIDSGGKEDTTFRYGPTFAFGYQIPLLMREKKVAEPEPAEVDDAGMDASNDQITEPFDNEVIPGVDPSPAASAADVLKSEAGYVY